MSPALVWNDLGTVNQAEPLQLQIWQQVDRMHWPRVVERTQGQGKEDGKAAWVRTQDVGFIRGQNSLSRTVLCHLYHNVCNGIVIEHCSSCMLHSTPLRYHIVSNHYTHTVIYRLCDKEPAYQLACIQTHQWQSWQTTPNASIWRQQITQLSCENVEPQTKQTGRWKQTAISNQLKCF